MKLVQRSLSGRSFLLQFFQIMEEFGDKIPWLENLKPISYSTNPNYFKDQFLRRLGCDEEEIIPFQFVSDDESREYIGGLLHFPKSPENFLDSSNIEISEELASKGYRYISCLQVRRDLQRHGHGSTASLMALMEIRKTHSEFWGIASKAKTRQYYESLGATTLSPLENKDGLWIMTWQ